MLRWSLQQGDPALNEEFYRNAHLRTNPSSTIAVSLECNTCLASSDKQSRSRRWADLITEVLDRSTQEKHVLSCSVCGLTVWKRNPGVSETFRIHNDDAQVDKGLP